MIDHLTIAMPYYEAPEMLREQLKFWKDFDDVGVEIVIVDDGSPNYPAAAVISEFPILHIPIHVYRICENYPWNHGGARNLAMFMARDGWVVLTDIDHVLIPHTVCRVFGSDLDSTKVYLPGRYEKNLNQEHIRIKRHSDSYLITKEMFWRIGGYDEQFTGYWNGPFEPFRKALKRTVKLEETENIWLLRYDTDSIADANVSEWGRKGSKFDINKYPIVKRKQRQAMQNYKPETLQFEWSQEL